jgi:hypothetical protein
MTENGVIHQHKLPVLSQQHHQHQHHQGNVAGKRREEDDDDNIAIEMMLPSSISKRQPQHANVTSSTIRPDNRTRRNDDNVKGDDTEDPAIVRSASAGNSDDGPETTTASPTSNGVLWC